MSRLIVFFVLLLTVPLEEAKKRKRSGEVYSYQSANNGVLVDVLKNTRGAVSVQSIDSNGNIQSQTVNGNKGPKFNSYVNSLTKSNIGSSYIRSSPGNVKIINANGNNLVLDLSINTFNNNFDDYYEDNNNSKIRIMSHYAQLMDKFIAPISERYNGGFGDTSGTTNILEYIFVHYYSGKVVSPDIINYLPEDLTTCPLVEYCLKETRPLCTGTITYCVSPMRKTAPCLADFNNGNKPCLTTTIPNAAQREEHIVLPCLTTLIQAGTKKKYCVTTIVVNTKIKETMANVERTVQSSMKRAQHAIQHGINAGRLGLERGMETMRKAFGRFPMFSM